MQASYRARSLVLPDLAILEPVEPAVLTELSLATPLPFSESARKLHDALQMSDLSLFDMRGEPQLETRFATPESDSMPGSAEKTWQWIESPHPLAHPVPEAARISPLRYFLDGSQRTLPGYYVGSVPIVASIVAAAILDRNASGGPALMPGTLKIRRAWICPRASGSAEIDGFIRQVESTGEAVIDPLAGLDEERYFDILSDFPRIEQRAYQAARRLRAELETELASRWADLADREPGWLVVDGALRNDDADTLGFIKSYSRQYLDGPAVSELFQLPVDCRSSAIEVDDDWRDDRYLVWYLRMRNASGRDPRHGLARIEMSKTEHSASIDDVSRWILEERRPSARSDERWATLLYPVHFLERILQQALNRETRAWPSAKG